MKYRCSIWTGPAYAVRLGRYIRRAGVRTPIIGTEHVYVDMKATSRDGAAWNVTAMLYRKYKTDFGLRPNCVTRTR